MVQRLAQDNGLFSSLIDQRKVLEERFVNGKENDLQREIISAAQEKLSVFKEIGSEIKTKVDKVNEILVDLHRLVRDNCAESDKDYVALLKLVPTVALT